MERAVACMSGSFKGVFVHGVLFALEDEKFVADAYAAASSSTLPAAYAAIRGVTTVGDEIWIENARLALEANMNMSEVVRRGIRKLVPRLRNLLFEPSAARFFVATSVLVTEEADVKAQGPAARRLGRRLLVDAARGDSSWRDFHLQRYLFDTRSANPGYRLDAGVLEDVLYATTRMLHAWPDPAFVNGRQHIDASYTTLCPAVELAALGYEVTAIGTEPGPLRRDMFSREYVPGEWNGVRIRVIQPDIDLRDLGVDFHSATPEGLRRAFEHGIAKGQEYLRAIRL